MNYNYQYLDILIERGFNESAQNSSEIESAIKQLKNGTVPWADNIAAEMLKSNIEVLTVFLHPIVREVWKLGMVLEGYIEL